MEQTQAERRSRICVVYEDEREGNLAAQVAAWRAANDWPDDGLHPLHVIRVVYGPLNQPLKL